ncbi:MAG: PH domain-containing protein [Phycisphaerales bacterium JB039]
MVRPARFRARPMLFSVTALALLGGLVGTVYFWLIADTRNWIMWPCLVLTLVVAGVFIAWKIQTLSAALEVTNKRAVERRGLLSRSTSEVLHDSIRNVTIRQSFWDRVWSVGEIGIASSGHEGIEIKIRDIPHPEKVRRIIDLYRPL